MTPLTRPGPCPYCDATNPNAEACIGVRLSALHGPGEHKLLCTELREAWDAGQAAASADAEALRVEIARLKAQTACGREWGSQLYEARVEIVRLKTEQAWRPIETAPTDGTRIMLLLPETYNYRIVTGQWVDAPRGTSDPTHWMPLPKVPQP